MGLTDATAISLENVGAYSRGCALFGSGGGGDTFLGEAMVRQAIADHGAVAVVPLTEVDPEQLLMPLAMIGAPAVARERIFSGSEGALLRDHLERTTGRRVGAVMVNEIGGLNGLLPIAWAAVAGLPVVDADGMGRAFPLVTQVTMRLAERPIRPCLVAGGGQLAVAIETASDRLIEALVRSATEELGGVCVASLHQLSAAEALGAVIEGSVSRALAAGHADSHHGRGFSGGRGDLATHLFDGEVVEVSRSARDDFVRGSAILSGIDANGEQVLRIEFQNENLVAMADGYVCATTPHIITTISIDDGAVVTTENLRYGQVLRVLGFDAPAEWLTQAGLVVSGPAAFGYEVECASPRPVAECFV
jgi:DUF917 family protein